MWLELKFKKDTNWIRFADPTQPNTTERNLAWKTTFEVEYASNKYSELFYTGRTSSNTSKNIFLLFLMKYEILCFELLIFSFLFI